MNRRHLIKVLGILPFSSLLLSSAKQEVAEPKLKAATAFNEGDYLKYAVRSEFTFENFFTSRESELAHFAAYAVCLKLGNSNNNPLTLEGPSGNGKTYLLYAAINQINSNNRDYKIQILTGEEFIDDAVQAIRRQHMDQFIDFYVNKIDVLIVDDVHHLDRGQVTQEVFERILRKRIDNNKQVILTTNAPVRKKLSINSRLVSLILGGPVIEIAAPSVFVLGAFLEYQAVRYNISDPKSFAQRNKNKVKSFRECLGSLNSEKLFST